MPDLKHLIKVNLSDCRGPVNTILALFFLPSAAFATFTCGSLPF